jgi:hypothetical protein
MNMDLWRQRAENVHGEPFSGHTQGVPSGISECRAAVAPGPKWSRFERPRAVRRSQPDARFPVGGFWLAVLGRSRTGRAVGRTGSNLANSPTADRLAAYSQGDKRGRPQWSAGRKRCGMLRCRSRSA